MQLLRTRRHARLPPPPPPPPPPLLLAALRRSSATRNLRLCRATHALITTSGLTSALSLTNNLISTYSRCASLSDSDRLFHLSHKRDPVTWNALLSAYAFHGHTNDGLLLFRRMRRSSVQPTRLTFASVLNLCSSGPKPLLKSSEAIHCCILRSGFDSDSLVSGALVGSYVKLGQIDSARYLFDGMSERDVVLWNVMISGYSKMGFVGEAFLLFSELHRSGLRPDDVSVRCVVEVGQVRAHGIKAGVFMDRISDAIVWNKTMSEHLKSGDGWSALRCFIGMRRSGAVCDDASFVVALSAAVTMGCSIVGEQIHGFAVKTGSVSGIPVANCLINMYAKTGWFDCAMKIFGEMGDLDLVTWNSMISNSLHFGLAEQSVSFFFDMLWSGFRPDQFTLASVLRACVDVNGGSSSLCEQIHVHAIKGGQLEDIFIQTALVGAYVKKNRMDEAERLYNKLDGFDTVACNAMISAYVTNGDGEKALNLFSSLHKSDARADESTLSTIFKACGAPIAFEKVKQVHAYAVKLSYDLNLRVASGILGSYIKCGDMDNGFTIFNCISDPDEITWTTVISGFMENGEDMRAFELYKQMRRSGFLPDEYTLAAILKACSCLAALELGKQMHANAVKLNCASDAVVGTSIIDMYAKCGSLKDLDRLFQRMSLRSIASWNAMVLGFAQHGYSEDALGLYEKMRSFGVTPDRITFVGVLSSCSRSGLVSEAKAHFNSMSRDYNIEPEMEHYSCLVDVLGRAGLISEAETFIEAMPFKGSSSMYRTLLSACRIQGNAEAGHRVAKKLIELEPSDSSAYVLLSNVYASSNKWDEMADAREMMNGMSVRKNPGLCWIE